MLTFIIGGARSGKSRRAQQLAEAAGGALVYIATAEPLDDEMADRIAHHRRDRDARWQTVEAPRALAAAIADHADVRHVLLIDCLTLWTSNLLLAGHDVAAAIDDLVATLGAAPGRVIVVSNEVGLGIVPDNPLSRQFRDLAGRLHQRVAAIADHVELMVVGLVVPVKPPAVGHGRDG